MGEKDREEGRKGGREGGRKREKKHEWLCTVESTIPIAINTTHYLTVPPAFSILLRSSNYKSIAKITIHCCL